MGVLFNSVYDTCSLDSELNCAKNKCTTVCSYKSMHFSTQFACEKDCND